MVMIIKQFSQYVRKTKSVSVDFNFLLIVLFSIVVNAILIAKYPNIGGDSLKFLLPIHHLFAGDGYSFGQDTEVLFSPGYGILSYVIYIFINDIEYSAMLMSGISYVGIVCVTYFGVKKIIDKRAAQVSALGVAVSPVLISLSYVTLADISYSFFIVLSFLLFIIYVRFNKGLSWIASVGFVVGFGALIRPDGLLIAVAIFVLLIFHNFFSIDRKSYFKIAFSHLFIFTLSFIVIILPYVIFLYHHTGNLTISNKFSLVVVGGSDVRSDLPIQASLVDTLVEELSANSDLFLERIYQNTKHCIYSFCVSNYYAIFPLFVVSFICLFLFKNIFLSFINFNHYAYSVVVMCFFSFPIIPYLLYARDDRRFIPYWTLFVILAMVMLYYLLYYLICKEKRTMWFFSFTILAIILIVTPLIPIHGKFQPHSLFSMVNMGHGHYGLRQAGFWLRDNVPLEDRSLILSRKPSVVVFYAYNKNIAQHYGEGLGKNSTIESAIALIKEKKLKYFILDEHYIEEMELMKPLWDSPELSKQYGAMLISGDNQSFKIFKRI